MICGEIVDLDRNTATWRGECVALSPQMAEALYAMLQQHPKPLSDASLLAALHGKANVGATDSVGTEHAYRLHKRLERIGLGVATFKKRGRVVYEIASGVPAGAIRRGEPGGNRGRNIRVGLLQAKGLSEAEIGRRLNLSIDTVQSAIERINRRKSK